MDLHPVQGGGAILLGMLHVKEIGISSGRVGLWLVCVFTFTLCCNLELVPEVFFLYQTKLTSQKHMTHVLKEVTNNYVMCTKISSD